MNISKIDIEEINYLSAEELIASRHIVVQQFDNGNKRVEATNTPEEAVDLEKAYDNLYQQLNVPHIERLFGRSLAKWDDEKTAFCVIRQDGKFQNFGYNINSKHYLEFYEAMYLLEQNRLQLEYHSMLVSIEQAYILLLGEHKSIKYNQYYVYACFSKSGYILIKHQNQTYDDFIEMTKEQCILRLLENSLYKKPIPEKIRTSPIFQTTQESMDNIKNSIRLQINKTDLNSETSNSEVTELSSRQATKTVNNAKRKTTNDDVNAKRFCRTIHADKSFVDILRDDPEYRNFQQIFEKLDIVKLESHHTFDENCRDLLISFDVYLPNDGFKRSILKPPKFRMIVLETNDTFPTHAEITKCYRQQKYSVPIIIASVSESKQMQAFLYYFSC